MRGIIVAGERFGDITREVNDQAVAWRFSFRVSRVEFIIWFLEFSKPMLLMELPPAQDDFQ